ncbi:hypothetical protein CRG98_012172 [Punica granatum]|uniref:Uncharacterized protein n=1 Tax=Punica granatum TaxID=22663 RepID=A0A2I0KGX6_PUNGR|nr:hypothetical protein CRG98_012172 [Punica granatum]
MDHKFWIQGAQPRACAHACQPRAPRARLCAHTPLLHACLRAARLPARLHARARPAVHPNVLPRIPPSHPTLKLFPDSFLASRG